MPPRAALCCVLSVDETVGVQRERSFPLDLNERDQRRYYLLMELFGGALDKRRAEERFAGRFERGLWQELGALRMIGAVRDRGASFELTERGHYLWVVIMREFFSGVNRLRDEMRHTNNNEMVAETAGE